MRLTSIVFCLFALSLLTACQSQTAPPDCVSGVPDGYSVRCGSLEVPEDYAEPDGQMIRLHYAVIHRENTSTAPDPIVFLAGGPGERVLDSMSITAFTPYLETRDLILFDQRGVGRSEPALACPEHREAVLTFAETNDPALEVDGVRACFARLQTEGVDLSAYTTVNNARDLDQLRQALGYETWNLLASSYGTQLALTAARDFPAGVRAIVLDSVYPLEKPLFDERAVNGAEALDAVFDACSGSPACYEAFPDLRATFNQTVERLNAEPAHVLLTTTDGRVVNARLNGEVFANLVYIMLFKSSMIPRIPQVIVDTASGNFAALNEGVAYFMLLLDSITYGMQYAFLCNDEVAYDAAGDIQSTAFAGLDSYVQTRKTVMFGICDGFIDSDPPALQNQPIITDIPTLILAGTFDPITPAKWSEALGQSLPNSVYVEYPSLAHGIALDECPAQMAVAFLNNLTSQPDETCISTMEPLRFAVRQAEYALVPFTSEAHGISGLYPEGWIHRDEADFYQDESRFTSLIYINYREKAPQQVMEQILPSYQLDAVPPLLRTYETKTLDFDLYQFIWQQRLTITLAVAETAGDTYMVALASPITDHPTLYSLVLLPALDALMLIP